MKGGEQEVESDAGGVRGGYGVFCQVCKDHPSLLPLHAVVPDLERTNRVEGGVGRGTQYILRACHTSPHTHTHTPLIAHGLITT